MTTIDPENRPHDGGDETKPAEPVELVEPRETEVAPSDATLAPLPYKEHVSAATPESVVGVPVAVPVEEAPAAPQEPQIVYVTAPVPPRKKGNRGVGILIAIVATLVFAAVFSVTVALVNSGGTGQVTFGFLGQPQFYFPILLFLVAFALLVLILNKAGWWAYIIGSVVVALVVYFGSIGLVLLNRGVVLSTASEAAAQFREGMSAPVTIFAALFAREVALWAGVIVGWRGRRVRVRNADALAAFDHEQAETHAAALQR